MGWIAIPYRAGRRLVFQDEGLELSGYIAFTAFFALFPFLIFLAALASFLGNPETANDFIGAMFNLMPDDVALTLAPAARDVIGAREGGILTVGILVTLWFASNGIEALRVGLNRAYGVQEARSIWWRRLQSIAFVIIGGFIIFFVSLAIILGPPVWKILGPGVAAVLETQVAFITMRYLLALVLLLGGLLLLHRWLPNTRQAFARVLPGVCVTTVLWLAGAGAFSWYVGHLAHYAEFYGSLGGVAITLMFFYISAVLFIFGAEINAVWRERIDHGRPHHGASGARGGVRSAGATAAVDRGASRTAAAVDPPRASWPGRHDRAPNRDPGRLNLLAATASIGVAATLIGAKLVIWILTGSVAILGTLIDSCLDAIASMVTFVSIRQAAQPPDRAHRYGHGKAEAIGAFVQAGFVLASALFLANEAVRRLISPQPIEQSRFGIAVLLLAVLVTAALIGFQRFVIRRTGSIAIRADSIHYRSDLLTNLAVVAALILTETTGLASIDPLFGLAIVLLLLYSAFEVARQALDMLMDRELPPEMRAHIRKLALEHAQARNVHDLRTRRAGSDVFIELHLELDGALDLEQAHVITHEVEARIRKAFPEADIVVHQEPAGLEDPRRDAQIARAER